MILPSDATDLTALLDAHRRGDRDASEKALRALYPELRRMAHRQLRGEHGRRTLDATGLVHELYLRIAGDNAPEAESRAHFVALCGRVMRQVLVDAARRRRAEKRGGGERPLTLEEHLLPVDEGAEQLIALHRALERLEQRDDRLARVVECRYFAGLSEREIADALGVTTRTVQRDWVRARAWLLEDLRGDPGVR